MSLPRGETGSATPVSQERVRLVQPGHIFLPAGLSSLVLLSPVNLNSLQLLQGYTPHVGPWELWLLLLPYSTQCVERASCLELQEMSQSRDSSPNWATGHALPHLGAKLSHTVDPHLEGRGPCTLVNRPQVTL